jgi:hypothetical protein
VGGVYSMRPVPVLIAVVLATASVAGCADRPEAGTAAATAPAPAPSSQGPSASPEPAATTSDAVPVGSDVATGTAAFPGDAEPDVAEPGAGADLTVTALRVAAQDGFDRVVLELSGEGVPGWDVRYVDQAADPGSGEPVAVGGAAVLQVQVTGIGSPYTTDRPEYSGPRTLTAAGTSAVQEVVWDATYEGVSLAFVGTAEQLPFRVQTLSSPTRVVIDVAHR